MGNTTQLKEIFANVFKIDGRLATRNLTPGMKVYDEELMGVGGIEYRSWNPYRSKLAAAIINGLNHLYIKPGSKVLYLGAATGTTSSHVSDIVQEDGVVYCIEISERNVRELIKVCEKRSNMLPLLQDARLVEVYADEVGVVDVIYQDLSARDQAEILLRNASLLKKDGYAYVAIKSQSISTSRKPKEIYKEFFAKLGNSFEEIQSLELLPYDKLHLFTVLRKL